MLTYSGADLCRLTVRAPERTFEIAVPTGVPLTEMLPALVSYAGDDLDEAGLEHDGWVVQRLGAEPLDEDATVAALGLLDGEVLYLRPRREQLPPVHFDDLTDGVSTTLRERPDSWRPEYSRRMMIGGSLLAFGVGLVILLRGGPAPERAAASAIVAVLALLGAVIFARAVGDVAGGAALGVAAVPYLAAAAALLPAGHVPAGERLLVASTAGGAAAALALAGAGVMAPLMLGLILLAVLGAIDGALMMAAGVTLAGAAGVTIGLVVIFGAFVPGIAFRLSGLRLPPLPSDVTELQEEIDPHPGREVIARTRVADHYMTALYGASGLASVVALTGLARTPRWPEIALGGVLSGLFLLHGRGLVGGWQRVSVILPGAYGAVACLLAGTWHASPLTRGIVVCATVMIAAALMVGARTMPGNRRLPHWGRAADLAQSFAAVALIPLILQVAGVYHLMRGFKV
jgi:type VII secretion integral membrane protein EccD